MTTKNDPAFNKDRTEHEHDQERVDQADRIVKKHSKRFDSRYDLSDDPMDQAKMAKLRRMDWPDEPDPYNPIPRR